MIPRFSAHSSLDLTWFIQYSAGKIASHGPYKKVKDIYKIPGLTDHDIALFKQYETEFTVHIPGRAGIYLKNLLSRFTIIIFTLIER